MTALALIPVALLLAACLYQPKRWRRLGYVERVVGRWPMPRLQPWQRVNTWRAKYDRCTIEQQTEPGDWPLVKTAVSGLHRELQTDPRQLAASIQTERTP
jgi:hypothetical protein